MLEAQSAATAAQAEALVLVVVQIALDQLTKERGGRK